MNSIFISALIVAVLVYGSHGRSCHQFHQCIPDRMDPTDPDIYCPEVTRSLSCLQAVFDSCPGWMRDNDIGDQIRSQVDTWKKSLAEKCGCSAIRVSFFTVVTAFLVYLFL